MKKVFIFFFVFVQALACLAQVNLTPREKTFLSRTGTCTFPTNLVIGVDPSLGDSTMTEVQTFADGLSKALSGYTVSVCHSLDSAFIAVKPLKKSLLFDYGTEGYKLEVKTDGIDVAGINTVGLFYALQSIKKMLPPHVGLSLPTANSQQPTASYTLPCCVIQDAPRFEYRGFMLDCSRHFFEVAEIKRMLDLMALYKMNTFHWHLTDDQGWRAEIKKYPLLTSVGATRSNSWNTDIYKVNDYWWTGEGANTGKSYGPYFYSQEEMKDIVAYAAERHIEVIPEIEMPGHAVAAMVAYPQFSCNPGASRSVWTSGGVSSDVMNVANEGTLQFCKDIIDEICDIFPGRYIHIGGDECPSSAWESNSECQALYKEKGFTSYRQLQSLFTNQISGYIASKGKRTILWNESITAGGSDMALVKEYNPVIMCWSPCQSGAQKAVNNGLDAIITEYHSSTGGYYINRRQSNDYGEPTGAGAGDDTVEGCYNYVPVSADNTNSHYLGVQGTFWTEHVSSNEYLEYLALPRLICLAEAGWTPQSKKDWDDFKSRITIDTEMLDLGGYIYGRHWMDGYIHRTYVNPVHDQAIVTFTNKSTDRGGRGLADVDGTLNGQYDTTTEWTLEAAAAAGEYYIKSNVSGKYLYVSPLTSGTAVTLSDRKMTWVFDDTTIEGYVAICPAEKQELAVNNNINTGTKTRLFAHGSGNGASFWIVKLMGEATAVGPALPAVMGEELGMRSGVYDLTGRKIPIESTETIDAMASITPGLVIVNGRKVFVR